MVKISEERKARIVKALIDNGVDVTIDWSKSSMHKQSQMVNLKCNKCGTTHTRATNPLARGSFHCPDCTVKSYTNNLAGVDFQYISHKGTTIQAMCTKCKTVTSLPNSTALRNSTPKCGRCLETQYTLLASKLGFDYIKTAPYSEHGSQTLEIRCKKDGNIVRASVSALKRGHVRCSECQLSNYKHELAIKNCTLVRTENTTSGLHKVKLVVYRNSQGETFEAVSGHIMSGDFAATKDGQWYDTHSTYMIKNIFNGTTCYKIGTAQSPEKRLSGLKLLGESKVYTLESFTDRFSADKLEKELHQEFKQFKLNPDVAEAFTGMLRKVKRSGQIERAYIKEGIHEWFVGEEVFKTLSIRYNLKEEQNGIDNDSAS